MWARSALGKRASGSARAPGAPGRWSGPGADGFGFEHDHVVERQPLTATRGAEGVSYGKPPGKALAYGGRGAEIYAQLVAAERQGGCDRQWTETDGAYTGRPWPARQLTYAELGRSDADR